MSRRTYKRNAFQTPLANAINATQPTIDLVTTAGLQAPGYGTIDHNNIALTEWVRYAGITGNTLTGVVRGLAGASGTGGSLGHAAGAFFRQTYTAQDQDDIFSDIEALEAADTAHAAAVNPHPGYATDADLATTNAVVATHTTDIAALEAADVLLGTDVDNLELAAGLHIGSSNGHPVATETTDGLISAADLTKLRRIGANCEARTSVTQLYSVSNFHYVVFDVDTYDPLDIHAPNSSLFIVPYTGIWVARWRNTATVIMNRTIMLRVGSTPGSGTGYPMPEGRDLGAGAGDPGQNVAVSGPIRVDAGTQLHLELGDQEAVDGANDSVAAGSRLILAYIGEV